MTSTVLTNDHKNNNGQVKQKIRQLQDGKI